MSEQTIETLIDLLDKYQVEIPIVQRDYAQGRQGSHTTMVRTTLLKDMKSALLGTTPPLDLSFVYGKVDGDKFIPLDGQQRLTTLFLLHLYAFRADESRTALFNRFTYRTRKSSRDFLEQLNEKRADIFSSALSPSAEIEDSEWFVSLWKHDPTVQSALVMLDAIKGKFSDVEDLKGRLLNSEEAPLTFKFLEMNDLGMEDSLYIKLNARGKPLTAFENLKAQLIGRQEELGFPLINAVKENFDGSWSELFWSEFQEDYDKSFLKFFGVLFMNEKIIGSDTNWTNEIDYEQIDSSIFETIYYTLDYLANNRDSKAHNLIFGVLNKDDRDRTYPDRVLFHAVTTYLFRSKGVDTGSLNQWLRIIYNLTMNTSIDTSGKYLRAIDEIDELADAWDDLLSHLSKGIKAPGFSSDQLEEEQIKAKLILENEEFAPAIYEAEQHKYFSGQIRSALHYAGFYKSDGDIELFKEYWEKISSLFDESTPRYGLTEGNLLRRALLTFGDYTLPAGKRGEYKTLCVDSPYASGSTPSMKRLFSENGPIAKALLDAIRQDSDFKLQLNEIINRSSVPKNDWRHCFIELPRLYDPYWMNSSHLRLREVDGDMLIVRNVSSTGVNHAVLMVGLHEFLRWGLGVDPILESEAGTWGDRSLNILNFHVRYKNGVFTIRDVVDPSGPILFRTVSGDPITEAAEYIKKHSK